ncbi:MAG: glycosyltransferase family 2 protein [Nitrosomonadales bacterium]|nr:glycosyltransferase family 2 protein [Nitrosomonadales bacterium]
MVALSIVVPLYNEEDNVQPLYLAIISALAGKVDDYEVLLVDDGSKDDTYFRAAMLVERDPRIRVVRFRRNYGQTAAMSAGIKYARGEVIVTMDGDLQNDPTDIPMLLSLIDQGFDIVVGWRRKRKDGGARVFVSKIANRIMARVMGVSVRDSGCSLKAYRAALIQDIPLYGEMHRFIPALSQLAGAKLAQVEVKHHPRRYGVSKYGFSRIYKVMLDIISIRALLSYAKHPLGWLIPAGFGSFSLGTFLVINSLFSPQIALIEASIGILLISMSLFLSAWGLLGRLLPAIEPDCMNFASLCTTLSARIERIKET